MSAKFLPAIFLTAFLAFGQDSAKVLSDTLSAVSEITETSQTLDTNIQKNSEQKPDISLENMQKRVKNPRYIVISAVTMMLFIGLCMGSVSAINPD